MTNEFDSIRPYIDSEVPEVIERLTKSDEFCDIILAFQFPRLNKYVPWLAPIFLKGYLKNKLGKIDSIKKVQEIIALYVIKVLDASTTSLTQQGLNEYSQDTSHLFISNHRDIVMDPGLIGYLLKDSVHGTVEIAIGDNLLKKDYISDLMRLNKSFIVNRSAQGREKLTASTLLSKYIHHSIKKNNNVWIAQREGRAKDGLDKTDPAILKMMHLGPRSESRMSLKDATNNLHIIPVSISYEYDPCAELKARELYEKETKGNFVKDDNSDIISISTGINGQKGDIHLCFSQEIVAENDDHIAIAEQIDKQIILNYKLFPSNYIAYELLRKQDPNYGEPLADNIVITEEKRAEFNDKYQAIPDELKTWFLKIYANPLVNKKQYTKA